MKKSDNKNLSNEQKQFTILPNETSPDKALGKALSAALKAKKQAKKARK
jgi:hypothetical protein